MSQSSLETFRGFVDSAILFEDSRGARSLYIYGWMLAQAGPLSHLEFSLINQPAVTAVAIDRSDVAERNPSLAHARKSGFCVSLPITQAAAAFYVQLRAQICTGEEILSGLSVRPICSSPTHRVAQVLLTHLRQNASRNLPRPDLINQRSQLIELCNLRLQAFIDTQATITFPRVAKPAVSVIIPTAGEPHFTLACLEALHALDISDAEVLVVDSSPSQETQDLLARFNNVYQVFSPRGSSFSQVCNTGASHAQGKNLLFLNNDAFPLPGSIESVCRTLDCTPSCGVVGAKLIRPDGLLQEAGSFILPNGTTVGRGRATQPELPAYNLPLSVDYCSAAFLLTPREIFADMGGFNEAFSPAYYEDVDYCVRIAEAGYTCIVDPGAAVIHVERGTSTKHYHADQLIQKNRELFLQLHPEYLTRKGNQVGIKAAESSTPRSILVVDDQVPNPIRGQGQGRAALILETLLDLHLSVSWYPAHGKSSDSPRNRNDVRIVLPNSHEPERDFLRRIIPDYDLVLVSRSHHMEQVQLALRSTPHLAYVPPIIYDAEAIQAQREILRFQTLHDQSLGREEIVGIISNELVVAKDASRILAASPREASIFSDFGFSAPLILGHGVNPHPTKSDFEGRRDFLTVGPLLDPTTPNTDGVQWFLQAVMPRLEASLTTSPFALHCVGECRVAQLAEQQGPRFKLIGQLTDMSPAYERHRVYIAPTRFSAGIPLKVLEAAAQGIPTVITPILANQLGWSDGVEALVGYDADDFASKCISLYTQPRLWRRIRTAALNRVSRDYSVAAFKHTLSRVVASI